MPFISILDMLKVGAGPSSSHTMGPWRAAAAFRHLIAHTDIEDLQVELFGSLAKTGEGHGSRLAVTLGLAGDDFEIMEPGGVQSRYEEIREAEGFDLGSRFIEFRPDRDVIFNMEVALPFHPNAMTFRCGSKQEVTFYSVGGGFILQEDDLEGRRGTLSPDVPYPVDSGLDLLRWTDKTGLAIHDLTRLNEQSLRTFEEIDIALDRLWEVMREAIYLGCHTSGILPGGLNVTRRAPGISAGLLGRSHALPLNGWQTAVSETGDCVSNVTDWISAFSLATNEVNASFGRIVTAPTNGAAGVTAAVLMYFVCFCGGDDPERIRRFLLVAGEIACLFKKNATISAAVGGCQAEIGVSSAMAAGGLCDGMGGTPRQTLMAAEIAMEHHLGMTCDPIRGLVQIPCIERNCMGAMQALTASRLAMLGDPTCARVSFDQVVQTMMNVANDMSSKYKETSCGGLAKISVGLPEC